MRRRAAGGTSPARRRPTYHLRLRPGDLPDCVLVPGDPDRASRIAATWDASEPVADNREFRSLRGRYRGRELGVVSAGIGGPAMAIVVDEVARAGARTLIRVGSCRAVDPGLRGGDVAITLAAARFERTSLAYAPAGFPAVAHPEVFQALREAAARLRIRYRTGITATVETFHFSEGRAGFRPVVSAERALTLDELRTLGVLNVEMETSALLTLAWIYRLRAGAVCAVYPVGPDEDPTPMGDDASIAVANEAARHLAPSPAGEG